MLGVILPAQIIRHLVYKKKRISLLNSIDDFHNGGRSARPGENGMKTRSQRPQTFIV